MAHESNAIDLMVVVERLSTQDLGRIVNLIGLLQLAPEAQRREIQKEIREMTAREPQTHAECLASIDSLISFAESRLMDETRGVQESGVKSNWPYGRCEVGERVEYGSN